MQTFAQFKTRLKSLIWPVGEQKNLRASHDQAFKEVMARLQFDVECLATYNVSIFEVKDLVWENAKMVAPAPFGVIRRVYTIISNNGVDDWRDKVRYRSSNWTDIECWARKLYASGTPVNAGTPSLPVGMRYMTLADGSVDTSINSTVGRARSCIWAINRHRLYVAPWIQTNEKLIMEWDGEKTSWADTDVVNETYWNALAEACVMLYVRSAHERSFGDYALGKALLAEYETALAEIMYVCREKTRQQYDEGCDGAFGGPSLVEQGETTTNNENEVVPPEPVTHVVFEAVGDIDNTVDGLALAAAIQTDNPDFFVGVGDLSYDGVYATDFGTGYGWAKTAGKVIPVIGNHDADWGTDFSTYLAYFASEVSNNGRYYEAAIGPIHAFIINSEEDNLGTDISSTSPMAEWLRVKLLLSPARWKVVFLHRPPYSSGTTHGGEPLLRWDYKGFGADLCIAAHEHNYERLLVGGLPYINCGTGGKSLYPFGSPVTGSLVRYNSSYGRLVGNATCDTLEIKFTITDGTVIDTLTLTK